MCNPVFGVVLCISACLCGRRKFCALVFLISFLPTPPLTPPSPLSSTSLVTFCAGSEDANLYLRAVKATTSEAADDLVQTMSKKGQAYALKVENQNQYPIYAGNMHNNTNQSNAESKNNANRQARKIHMPGMSVFFLFLSSLHCCPLQILPFSCVSFILCAHRLTAA